MKVEIKTSPDIKAIPTLNITEAKESPLSPNKSLLSPGELGAVLEVMLRNRQGVVTHRQVKKAESFVGQFLRLLFAFMMQGDEFSALPAFYMTDGGIQSVKWAVTERMAANAPISNDSYGIQVGSGGAAVTLGDYALATKIAHGVAAGQLQYSAMTFGAPASDATLSQFTLTRDFSNGSGGAVTVRETGLVLVHKYSISAFAYFMALRDVIADIVVPNGETLTVNYRIQAVV